MEQLSRNGHRQRMRNTYLKNGVDIMEDYQVLELFLSLIIPQKDVKQLSYDLINCFGSIDAVFKASPQQLMQVKGVGKCVAVAISLVNDLNGRVKKKENNKITHISNSQTAREYVQNEIGKSRQERVIAITLNNDMAILGCHTVSNGSVNTATVEPKKVLEYVLKDDASSVILAHNHPDCDATPSAADINLTVELLGFLRKLNVHLVDHIIVGENDVISLNSDARYMMYFD